MVIVWCLPACLSAIFRTHTSKEGYHIFKSIYLAKGHAIGQVSWCLVIKNILIIGYFTFEYNSKYNHYISFSIHNPVRSKQQKHNQQNKGNSVFPLSGNLPYPKIFNKSQKKSSHYSAVNIPDSSYDCRNNAFQKQPHSHCRLKPH